MGFRVPAPDSKKAKDGLPVMVLMENTVLKNVYRTRYLTTGGMAVIYLAYCDAERYIIKEVDATDTKNVMSLTQEKAMLERIDHHGIVKVYDLFEEDGFCYLVMEYIEGMTLDRKTPLGSDIFLSESVVRDWALQLMDIFEYLHRQKPPIIYRDLKPKNIMIDKNAKIRLIDFGIARTFKEGKSMDTDHMGSMITASPEHYGGAQTDHRSDIYTLGATLHFIVTNGRCVDRDPFDFPPVKSFNSKLSDNFQSVVAQALAMDPDERFQSIAEMRHALRGAEQNETEGQVAGAPVVQETISLDDARKARAIVPEEARIEVRFVDTPAEVLERAREHKKNALTTIAGIVIGIALAALILFIMNLPRKTGVIDWKEAKHYYNKEKTVEGMVVKVFHTAHNNIYLHFNTNMAMDFCIIIYNEYYPRFNCIEHPKEFFTTEYKGRHVRVTGMIKRKEIGGNDVPSIFVTEPGQIEVR
jgi:tRNA A-37 threonylcarbamoyl transferase component Bud32